MKAPRLRGRAHGRDHHASSTGVAGAALALGADPPIAVLTLADEAAFDTALVGGKAAGLARALRVGVRVPAARVIGVDAFHAFAREAGVTRTIALLESSLTTLADQHIRGLARDIVGALRTVPLPPHVDAALRRARTELGPGPLICRSSAIAEDSAATSLAGAFRSIGGIQDDDTLAAAAVACWCSLFDDRALTLAARMPATGSCAASAVAPPTTTGPRPPARPSQPASPFRTAGPIGPASSLAPAPIRHGNGRTLAMALVIQREIRPTAGGVAFTRDPLSARPVEISPASNVTATRAGMTVVEAVAGSPADLVAGRAEPWRYVRGEAVHDGEWQLTARPVGEGEGPWTAGGPLTRDALIHIADSCRRLADAAGTDVDVEFGLTAGDDTPWILQCRPITMTPADVGSRAQGGYAGVDAALATTIDRNAGDGNRHRFTGVACSGGMATGRGIDIRRLGRNAWPADDELRRSILLLDRLTVDEYELLFRCAAIVTERRDAQLSHVAIACREIGVPYIAGIADARVRLHDRTIVVHGSAGTVHVVADREVQERRGAQPDGPHPAESDVARIERLLIESLPARPDAWPIRRWLAYVLRGSSPVRLAEGGLSFTDEEGDLIRRCVGFDPTRERIFGMVQRAARTEAGPPHVSGESTSTSR